jgi:DNA helicase-2/ATP-dependent DNA helicase PcrA
MQIDIVSQEETQLFQNLNSKQAQAVRAIDGTTLVIAGAGSGKTAVLTRRVAYLIYKGVVPGSILCLTFTNKAAREMQERVRTILESVGIHVPFVPAWMDDYTQSPLISTFHSLGVKLLREFGHILNYKPDITILDDDEQKKIIKNIFKAKNINEKTLSPKLVSYFISQCKQELLIARDSRRLSKDYLPVFHEVYRGYEQELRANNCVDFDDLLLLPYLILLSNAEALSIVQDRWLHVLVDEFQDTNQAQFELVKLIIPPVLLQN